MVNIIIFIFIVCDEDEGLNGDVMYSLSFC